MRFIIAKPPGDHEDDVVKNLEIGSAVFAIRFQTKKGLSFYIVVR